MENLYIKHNLKILGCFSVYISCKNNILEIYKLLNLKYSLLKR